MAALSFLTVAVPQSRITRPQSSSNSNNASKRQRVATLRASDSSDGSRVALTANQSLNDYEAYRRGDRFYVKIPPADVPRAEAVRGRAFADVKVNRSVDSTIVSFRLQPGATAHVEQRGNKLDVVIKMPGARSSSTAREVARNNAGPAPPDNKRRAANSNTARITNSNLSTNKNAKNANAASRRALAGAKPSSTPKANPSPVSSPAAATLKPSPSPQPTKALTSAAQAKSSPTPSPAAANVAPAQGDFWSRLKERARYWILVAQLNPVPVGIGVAVLLLLIGLLILQRRRAKTTRRARPRKSFATAESVAETSKATGIESEAATSADVAPVVAGAAVASAAAGSTEPASENGRVERVSRASDEVKKLMTGGEYDQNIIAANDRDTRQLVGAELLSALVGRNVERRERARDAFMKHGYFDDATRDLRVAESANERAAAARRLSFVRNQEATPHLVAALDDSSPDVRRAAVEALMDLRDPSAIAPLNSLMQTETDRKVPRSLIKHAIDACATGAPEEVSPSAADSFPAAASASPATETEREVIEI